MPTWKLNPNETPLVSVLNEFIKRRGIDVTTKRGQARVRAAHALIKAIATENPEELVPHFNSLEDGDDDALIALADDWGASLQRMLNERRLAARRN